MSEKRFLDYITRQKSWYHNLLRVVINYRHRSEANAMYTIHMNHRCRLDRMGDYPSVWRWK